jgi:hypothetical protein
MYYNSKCLFSLILISGHRKPSFSCFSKDIRIFLQLYLYLTFYIHSISIDYSIEWINLESTSTLSLWVYLVAVFFTWLNWSAEKLHNLLMITPWQSSCSSLVMEQTYIWMQRIIPRAHYSLPYYYNSFCIILFSYNQIFFSLYYRKHKIRKCNYYP